MFMGFIIHFYIIFGTNLLTGGPTHIAVFLPISVFRRKGISNGMKPSGNLFLEQKQSKELGVQAREASRRPRDRGRAHPLGAPSTLVGPSRLPRPTSFAYILPNNPKPPKAPTHTLTLPSLLASLVPHNFRRYHKPTIYLPQNSHHTYLLWHFHSHPRYISMQLSTVPFIMTRIIIVILLCMIM